MSVKPAVLALAILAFASASGDLRAQPEEAGEGEYREIVFPPDGLTLEQALAWAKESTGRTFQFKTTDVQGKPKILMSGISRVRKDRMYEFWQAVFVTQGFAMVPTGGDGAEFFISVEPIDTSRNLKQRASYVPVEDLPMLRDKVGEIIMTTIPLVHIQVASVRNAVNQIMAQRNFEFALDVPPANSLVVVGFCPTVYALHQVLKAMDLPAAAATLKFEKIALDYAVAEELQPIIQDLITPQQGAAASGVRVVPQGGEPAIPGQETPPPKLIADPRTNSLVVYAVESDLNEIKRLVAALDTEVTGVDSNIRIYFLKNTNASDIEGTLRDLLGQSAPRTQQGTGIGRPGQQASTTNARGQEVVIVSDSNTNSLIIQASRTRYEEIRPLIEELDRRRPAVLVQAAIAELSDTDLQNIAVEVTAIEGGDSRYRFAGATGFGLSTITTGGGGNGGTGGTGGTGTGTGGGTPSSGSDGSGGLLNNLVRIPFATATGIGFSGLAAGIFERNLNVPLLISMLKTYTKVNLLSTASVLTNDHENSTITVGRTITTARSETTAAGIDRVTADRDIEANLTLRISPHISNDNYLRLDIQLLVEAFQGIGVAGLPPPRTRREFVGSVTVPNGKTVVIGGLVQDNYTKELAGVPFFSDIPILGELFKSTSESTERTTLYLFVTPTIIDSFQRLEDASYEKKLEVQKLGGNIHLIDPNFRVLGIDDRKIDIRALDASGVMDMPSYSPVTPVGAGVDIRPVEGNPLRPSRGAEDESIRVRPGGSVQIRDGQILRDK